MLHIADWDHTNILITRVPKPNSKGGKNVPLKSGQTKEWLTLQLPAMKTPFGIQDYHGKGGGFNIKLVVTDEVLAKMEAFETFIVNHAAEHAKVWFGKAVPREVVEYMFSSSLKRHEKWPAQLQIGVAEFKKIAPKSRVEVAIMCHGIWISDKLWGISWEMIE